MVWFHLHLCDFGDVIYPFCGLVFSSVKQDNVIPSVIELLRGARLLLLFLLLLSLLYSFESVEMKGANLLLQITLDQRNSIPVLPYPASQWAGALVLSVLSGLSPCVNPTGTQPRRQLPTRRCLFRAVSSFLSASPRLAPWWQKPPQVTLPCFCVRYVIFHPDPFLRWFVLLTFRNVLSNVARKTQVLLLLLFYI